MPFPLFFLAAAALGAREGIIGSRNRRERATTIQEQFSSTRGALEDVLQLGILTPEQLGEAEIINRRINQAETNSKSKDPTLRSRGFQELDAARETLRGLERSIPTLGRAKQRVREQKGIRREISIDATQEEAFSQRGSEIADFLSLGMRTGNQAYIDEADQLQEKLRSDQQTFRAQQATQAEKILREDRDNIKNARLLDAANARTFALADRKNAIDFQKELSTKILQPLGDIQKFYQVIIDATNAPNGVVDRADLVTAGIAFNKLFNPQAEASDEAVRIATGNLASNVFGFALADVVDDFGKLIGPFGFSEISVERIKDIRRNATTAYNAAIEMAIRRGDDLRTRSGLTIQDTKNLRLVGLDRLDRLTVIDVPDREKRESTLQGRPTVLFQEQRQ